MSRANLPEKYTESKEKNESNTEKIAELNEKYIKHAEKELKRLSAYIRDEKEAKGVNLKIASLVMDLRDISRDLKKGKIKSLISSSASLDGTLKDIITSINPILERAGKKTIDVPKSTLLSKAGKLAEELNEKNTDVEEIAKEANIAKNNLPAKTKSKKSKGRKGEKEPVKSKDSEQPAEVKVTVENDDSDTTSETVYTFNTDKEEKPAEMLLQTPKEEYRVQESAKGEKQEEKNEEIVLGQGKSGGIDIGDSGKTVREAYKKEEERKLPPRNIEKKQLHSSSDWENAFAFGSVGTNLLRSNTLSQRDMETAGPGVNLRELASGAASTEKLLQKLSKNEDEELKTIDNSFTDLSKEMNEIYTGISNGNIGPEELGEFLTRIDNIKKEKLKGKYVVEKLQDSNIEISAYQGEKTKFKDIPTNKTYKVYSNDALELIYSEEKGDELRKKLANAGTQSRTQEKYIKNAKDILKNIVS